MNKLWMLMILLSIVFFISTGSVSEFSESLMRGCGEAVEFLIGICAVMGMWSGLMNVAKETGMITSLASKCRSGMRYLFPDIEDEDTIMMIVMGFTANVFGAGNSATVFSIKAMEKLEVHNRGAESASNAMCMFAAVNMSMLQLVPATVIQIRAASGSDTPDDIILPSIIAGLIATITSVAVCKYFENMTGNRHKKRIAIHSADAWKDAGEDARGSARKRDV